MIVQLARRDQLLVGAGLILLSGVAWITSLQTMSGSMTGTMADGMMPASALENLLLFLGTWGTMMTAMMLPSILPMVVTYAGAVRAHNSPLNTYARTTVFVSGYVTLWIAAGLLFYAANTFAPSAQGILPSFGVPSSIFTGAVLILAGVYQLTPLKDRCLTGCRTPLGFVASRWHEGLGGGFRMGLEHGLECLGCCGAMLVALAVFGLMNLPVMVLLTLWILAEKLLPFGSKLVKPAAVGFIASGCLLILFPTLMTMV